MMSLLNWPDRERLRYGIALGGSFLLAARSSNRASMENSIETSRLNIPPDLISVSAVEPNVRAVSKLALLAGEALQSVGGSGKRVAMVLPDMAIRSFVLPREVKPTATEVLARIAPRLSYPQGEARLATWQGPNGWTLAATVRQAVLRQYEQALEALGCHVAWVDGASLISIPEWVNKDRESGSSDDSVGLRVLIQLYPRHYTLSVLQRGELLDLRTKLRSPGDESRVAEQLSRLPTIFEGARIEEVTLMGEGARSLGARLEVSGLGGERVLLGDDGEEAHLTYALALLFRRS